MQLYIKNMVCDRCILVVRQELERIGFQPQRVELGKAEISGTPGEDELRLLARRLEESGFSLLEDKRLVVVERIKNLIITLVHQNNNVLKVNLSELISTELHQDYSSLSKLFSETESTTIEQYYIAQKIERVKELLSYNELTLSEIALQLNYSSSAHLSSQFRKVTGSSPREFRNNLDRKSLDEV
jgi:AraC-like DNA-binding protein